jgi:hypothetical protein
LLSPGFVAADHHEKTEKAESCAAKKSAETYATANPCNASAPQNPCAAKKPIADEKPRAAEARTPGSSDSSL